MSGHGEADLPRGVRELVDAPLLERCTFRVPARAHRLFELHAADALPGLLESIATQAPVILGGGSNTLFTHDCEPPVIQMCETGIRVLQSGATGMRLRVAAGEVWDDFVRWSLAEGLAGLENLILIPGTVGAAPIQNIGAYGVEVSEFIRSVEAWDRRHARFAELSADDCQFAYRDSRFKRHPGRYIVTAVEFELPRERSPRLDYAGLREELAGDDRPAPLAVAQAVERLRRRKLPDPAQLANAGSFFKNPIVIEPKARELQRYHPDLPIHELADGNFKLSAAWLIDACGFKGRREGDAGVFERHALVLVNHGHATGAQVWALAMEIREAVEERFGIRLEPEPRVL